jgi:hypothetical protein
MGTAPSAERPLTSPAGVATAAEAAALTEHLAEVVGGLIAIVQQETELVRVGRLGAAEATGQQKADLSRLYIADMLRLRGSERLLAQLAPERRTALRERHDALRTLLQKNLTVLATAHAVAEGIVRAARSASSPPPSNLELSKGPFPTAPGLRTR